MLGFITNIYDYFQPEEQKEDNIDTKKGKDSNKQHNRETPEARHKQGTTFTTQYEVLNKHHQGVNEKGEFVGMCEPMTEEYADTAMKKGDTHELLDDDVEFLSRAITRENRELRELKANASNESKLEAQLGHNVFKENNLLHSDINVVPGALEPVLTNTLKNETHVMVTVQTGPTVYHEAYIGRTLSGHCRFFDANYPGGEKKGDCTTIIHDFHKSLQRFPVDKYPAMLGVSREKTTADSSLSEHDSQSESNTSNSRTFNNRAATVQAFTSRNSSTSSLATTKTDDESLDSTNDADEATEETFFCFR